MKNKKLFLLSMLPFILSNCTSNEPLTKVPFNLKNFIEEEMPPQASLLKSEEEFNSFLKNERIFTNYPSEEFNDINKKYDANYFETKDLVAVITQATSSMIYGYSLKQISKDDSYWCISLTELAKSGNVTSDMGDFFCYYIELEKDPGITGAKLVW